MPNRTYEEGDDVIRLLAVGFAQGPNKRRLIAEVINQKGKKEYVELPAKFNRTGFAGSPPNTALVEFTQQHGLGFINPNPTRPSKRHTSYGLTAVICERLER